MDNESLEPIARKEHSAAAASKKVQIRGLSASDGNYYNVPVILAGSVPALPSAIVDGSGNQVTSFDTELPAAAALADDTANPTVPAVGAYLVGYNRANGDWDRVTVSRTNADGLASHTAGNLVTQARLIAYNGTTWDRVRGDTTNGIDVDVTRMPTSATPSQSSVAGSATSVTLLASNTSRKGATVFNDSTAILYVKLGATASTTSFTVKMQQDDYYEVPFGYTGIIDGIWASATGNARITELT